MGEQFADLFAYEKQQLLEALRRDLRSERCKIKTQPDDAMYHEVNCRVVLKVLETLNPKRARSEATQVHAIPTADSPSEMAWGEPQQKL